MLTPRLKEKTTSPGWKPVLLFLSIAYGLAWVVWLPVLLGPQGLHLTQYGASIPVFVSAGTLGPFIASFLAVRYETGRWGMPSSLLPGPSLRNWLNLLTSPLLVIVAFVVIPYMVCVAPGHKLLSLGFLAPLLAVWPNILGGPLEEEFGWRGYLLPRLSIRVGRAWATVAVGIVWASWHLPLMLCHVWAGLSFWYYLPLVTAVAVFASLAYFATGGSILGPIILHYVFNTCSAMLGAALAGLPMYGNRDVNRVILVSVAGVALALLAGLQGVKDRPFP